MPKRQKRCSSACATPLTHCRPDRKLLFTTILPFAVCLQGRPSLVAASGQQLHRGDLHTCAGVSNSLGTDNVFMQIEILCCICCFSDSVCIVCTLTSVYTNSSEHRKSIRMCVSSCGQPCVFAMHPSSCLCVADQLCKPPHPHWSTWWPPCWVYQQRWPNSPRATFAVRRKRRNPVCVTPLTHCRPDRKSFGHNAPAGKAVSKVG